MYTIDISKYSTKNGCNTVITLPTTHKHPSSGAKWPSHIAVTVNSNAEFHLMAVNPIITCDSRNLVPKYCQGLEYSAFYTASPIYVESLPSGPNTTLPCLPFHMHSAQIISTFLTSSIHIGLSSAKCKWVWKQHAMLPDPLADLTGASKYFQDAFRPPWS